MQEQFWKERWIEGQIGFHKDSPHDLLVEYHKVLGELKNKTILVPLCGKSLDLLFLKNLEAQVTGVELSELALDQFEVENKLSLERTISGDYQIRKTQGLELICGNFFALNTQQPFDAIYDRAAAIALPVEMRKIYFEKLQELLAPGGSILMIFISSEGHAVPLYFGPPFFIPRTEIDQAFSRGHTVELLTEKTSGNIPERYINIGVTNICETALKITKLK